MSQFAEPVIPEGAKRLSGIQKKAATGSRLAPATGGLGRDDDCLLSAAKQEQGDIFCNG